VSKQAKKRMWQILCVGTLFCMMSLLLVMPCLAQKAPKGEIVIAIDEPFVMNGGDPHTAQGTAVVNLGYQLYDGLVRRNTDGHYIPALAKSWEVAKDGMSIKFVLNERAKFHHGEPVTAKDVKFSFERAMRPELKYARASELVRNIDRIEIVDDYHINFYFKSPFLGFFEWAGHIHGIVPKAYVEKVGDAEFAKHPIGTGPFRMIDFQQDVFANLEAVPDHYRKVPSIKKLHWKFRVDPATLVAMFKAGEADMIRIPVPNFPEFKNNPNFKIEWSKFYYGFSLVFLNLAFANEPSPFHDIRVRRAASYAINRKAICEKLLNGTAEPWADIYAPFQPGFNPNLKPTPYDPEKAKALLKEAGYPNGFDTTFNYGFIGDKLEAQAMAADLGKVGIRAKLVELEFGTFIRNFMGKKLHGLARHVISFWCGQMQPAAALQVFSSSEYPWSYYVTPEIDTAWKKLDALVDEKEIAAQAKKFSQIYREAELRSTLWAAHLPYGLSQRIKSYKPMPGWLWTVNLEYLELKD
jgi:peptide/nickel transport system substrate-binding protein